MDPLPVCGTCGSRCPFLFFLSVSNFYLTHLFLRGILFHRKGGSPVRKRLSSSQIIFFGFAALILLGSVLLSLPISVREGQTASFGTGLFTATSAVCVTGLAVADTATYFSGFGQAVLLLLIQIGGMGVVTVAVSIAMFSGRKIGLMQRGLMQESISAPNLGGIVKLTRFILRTSFCAEALGALLLYPAMAARAGRWKGIWYAVFHSVSAFCNAGFDLMGGGSLSSFAASPLVNLTVCALILFGGLGFLTWEDFRTKRFSLRRYRMQSKTILAMSVFLLTLPFLFFYFYEFNRPVWGTLSGSERFYMSLFQTVTPRTAGFNTADLAQLSDSGRCVTVLLMLVGGAPGSTAGGMKITTFAGLFASARAVFERDSEARIFRRRVPQEAVRSAAAIATLYVSLLVLGSITLSCVEELPLSLCIFECTSAICTVGLSVGLTASLGALSRGILILLMFLGRIGALTLVFAALNPTGSLAARYPKESITVG